MSWIYLVAVFCILAGCVQAQDDAQFVGEKDFMVQKGDQISLKCTVSADAVFLVQKQLEFVHLSAKPGSKEKNVSRQGTLEQPYANMADTYELAFKIKPTISAELIIKQVTDDMDGQYFCRVMYNRKIQEEVDASVTVLAGVENLEMTVGEENLILDESRTIKLREGQIQVACTVTGTNPEPVIHLKLDDEMIDVDNIIMPDNDKARRSFRGSVEYTLDFKPEMFGKRLSCHAETQIPEGYSGTLPDKTVSVNLQGIVDKPTVFCHNKTAGGNDRQVTIKCLVSKNPMVKSVTFRLRDPGSQFDKVVLSPGNKTESLTECYKRAFNGTFTEYVLKFYQMEEWHFKANIYFDVVGMDNKLHQQVVYLIKDVSAATSITATITVPILLALLTFLI